MLWNKWVTFSSAVLLEFVSGLQYSFSVYSEALKQRHGLSQGEVNCVGTAINFGNCVSGVIAGAVFDGVSSSRRPWLAPKVACVLALLLASTTYPALWGLATGRWNPVDDGSDDEGEHRSDSYSRALTTWLVALAFLAASSGPFCDATALAVSVQNFPRFRGQVVGQLKAFVGLSASLHLVVYAAFPPSDPSNFLLLQTAATLVYISVGFVCQNVVPFKQADEENGPEWMERKFVITFVWGIALAVYVAVATVVPVSHTGRVLFGGGLLVLLAALLLWMSCSSGGLIVRREGGSLNTPLISDQYDTDGEETSPRGGHGDGSCAGVKGPRNGETSVAVGGGGDECEEAPPPPTLLRSSADGSGAEVKALLEELPEVPPFDAWRTSEFWMLYLVVLFGTGAGLSFVNNLGQLVVSYGGVNGDQNIFVAIFSVCSCLGRSVFGEVSQRMLVARGTPRPAFLALSSILTTTACVINSHGSLAMLYPGAVVAGFSFGSFWCLMPAVVSEMFGTRFFATIYSSICTSPGAGSFLLATLLTSYIYEGKAAAHGEGATCVGADCFRGAFFLMGLMSLCGMSLSLIVVAKSRTRYLLIHRWLACTR